MIMGGQSFSGASGDKSEPNHDPSPSGSDRWILKTDIDGIKEWDRTIGGNETDDLSRIIQTPDGGYLLSGESYSDTSGHKTEANLGPEQTWVVKTDSLGIVVWDKTIFTEGHDESGSAVPYGEDCFVVVNFTLADTGGYKSVIGWGYGDYWMVKLCEGNPLAVHESTDEKQSFTIYPNPSADEFTLLAGESDYMKTVEITDISGRVIYTFNGSEQNEKKIQLNATSWPSAIYLCRITGIKSVETKRIIKTE
jgi:hypothetical protein